MCPLWVPGPGVQGMENCGMELRSTVSTSTVPSGASGPGPLSSIPTLRVSNAVLCVNPLVSRFSIFPLDFGSRSLSSLPRLPYMCQKHEGGGGAGALQEDGARLLLFGD